MAACSSEGGRWTDAGGRHIPVSDADRAFIGDRSGESDHSGAYRVAVIDGPQQYSVDLAEEEHTPQRRGGHAIAEHVGKSKAELQRRMDLHRRIVQDAPLSERYEHIDAVGSFTDVVQANELVNVVLGANSLAIDDFVSGKSGIRPLVIQMKFDRVTGYEAYRPYFEADVSFRQTYSVRVVIRRAPGRKRGYNILTAFPTNNGLEGRWFMPIEEKSRHYEYVPEAFCRFVIALDVQFYLFPIDEHHLGLVDETIAGGPVMDSAELREFLDYILTGGFSDAFLDKLWRTCGPIWQFSPGYHRELFERALQCLDEVEGGAS